MTEKEIYASNGFYFEETSKLLDQLNETYDKAKAKNEDKELNEESVEHELRNKYERVLSNYKGDTLTVDVYDVLLGFNVTCPIMSHAAKKVLAAGERGHKDKLTDLYDIKASIERAIEVELLLGE